MNIDITYRGPLASCDYACGYCPFAKQHDDAGARAIDKDALERFVNWVGERQDVDNMQILITPWGEALVRKWYRAAMVRLSHMPHVSKVVIQTNLSCPVTWLAEAEAKSVALWTTFHPTETTIEKFVSKTSELDVLGVAYSVGIVGKNENQAIAAQLKGALNSDTYLWVNAYKDDPLHYTKGDIEYYRKVDPLFDLNNQYHPSLGKECRAGSTAISVDGEGNAKPCHFVGKLLGNIYEQELHSILRSTYLCPNNRCGCYIGYRHLKELSLNEVYGEKVLERIKIAS
ncbi:radical SAM protein [Gammaproteobacteria bacterium 45_16_T64]|nr:radical SAM protein [Gammaproteobacteria bacterium 45_16_T64]